MNPSIELKKTAPLVLITLTLHCFALLPQQEQQIAALTADFHRLAADIELDKAESRAVAEK